MFILIFLKFLKRTGNEIYIIDIVPLYTIAISVAPSPTRNINCRIMLNGKNACMVQLHIFLT